MLNKRKLSLKIEIINNVNNKSYALFSSRLTQREEIISCLIAIQEHFYPYIYTIWVHKHSVTQRIVTIKFKVKNILNLEILDMVSPMKRTPKIKNDFMKYTPPKLKDLMQELIDDLNNGINPVLKPVPNKPKAENKQTDINLDDYHDHIIVILDVKVIDYSCSNTMKVRIKKDDIAEMINFITSLNFNYKSRLNEEGKIDKITGKISVPIEDFSYLLDELMIYFEL